MKRGFTLLEILMVLGVVFVLAAIVTSALSNFKKSSLLTDAKTRALAELNLARSQTLASESNFVYGVHFESSKIVRFKGEAYSSSDPLNQVFDLPAGAAINSISLGGPVDVTFERLTGRASASGTVVFKLPSEERYATVTIYFSGIAE
ncbi:MAG: type II secretion system protein [bacterium]|nr:type II secretion system protein [bacterium]